jgi:hypothetical protein
MAYGRYFWEIACAVTLLGAPSARAARPLFIDDADPVDRGIFEFEAGAIYEGDPGSEHWDFPFGLTYGLVQDVEIGFAFGGRIAETTHRESGIGDLHIGAKWRFFESGPMGARHALVPSVKLPTADEEEGLGSGETDYDLTWVVSWAVGDRAGLHYNLGYTWIGGQEKNAVHYGLAVDYQLADPIQWVGEVFAENEVTDIRDAVVACNSGFRWLATDALTLDIAAGTKIRGDAPDIALTMGMTYSFGAER